MNSIAAKAYAARDNESVTMEPLKLSERTQSEQNAFLVRLDDATRPVNDPEELIQIAVRLLGEYLEADRCVYADIQEDGETLHIAGDYTRLENTAAMESRNMQLPFTGMPIVIENIEKEDLSAATRDAYRSLDVMATITVPLCKTGKVAAILAAHQKAKRLWRPQEVDLVARVANRCWESLERTRVTRALQTSERLLRLSQEAGGIGSFEWLIQEDRVTWTPGLEALFELPEGAFEGNLESWSKRTVPEDVQNVMAIVNRCLEQGEAECGYEFRAILPDGHVRWLRGQAQVLYDERSAPARMIGVNIDIDDQKQAEAHLKQQWHMFDTVLSNTPDLTYSLDLSGRFTYANRALLSLLQLSMEGIIGKNFFDLKYPPELAQKLQQQIEQVIETRQVVRDLTPFAGPTGETRQYEYIFTPVLSNSGAVESVAGSTRDITERKQAEEQEREREEQMRESARLESLGVMAGGIAHDFNNLLTGITGNACLLAETAPGPESGIASEIIFASQRASDLTRQMLAFSGKGQFVTEVMDLNALIQENLTLLRASLSRTVTVELALSGDGCFVEADRSQLQQIVMNLLINASEAIEGRPGKVTIRTAIATRLVSQFSPFVQTAVPAGRYVLVEVRDDGSGMSPETLRKIFDPFFTTKFTGRGLGLAAVLGIVKGHQGDIEVITQEGQGTTFRILLPAVDAAREPLSQPEASVVAGVAGQSVLVADDEEVVRKIATIALNRRGYRVLTATNGEEALEMLRQDADISLVILDLTMPVMTGEQAIPLIKALRPGIPIILSSGFSEAEIARRIVSAGVTWFLQKPYTVAAIAAKVKEALEK